MAGYATENVTKLSFASERMQAAERARNFVDFSLQSTSSVSEVSRCRSPLRYLPSSLPTPDVMQMRGRTVAVHRR